MRMRMAWILAACACMLLPACRADSSMKEEAAEAEEEEQRAETEEQEEFGEILLDYPFGSDMEGWTLALAASREIPVEYEILLKDEEGNLMQRLPCGKLTEQAEIFFDDLMYDGYMDLELFPGEQSGDTLEEEQEKPSIELEGSLYVWDRENQRFLEEPVRIPRYERLGPDNHWNLLAAEEAGDVCRESIFRVVWFPRPWLDEAVEVRSRTFWKEDGRLLIQDCLDGAVIFDGTVETEEDGEWKNTEYYDFLFWEDLPYTKSYDKDPVIRTWLEELEEDGKSHMETYESREALLEDCGFIGAEPFFQYYDMRGDLQLELYLDEERGMGCGFRYYNFFTGELEKDEEVEGFTFRMGDGQAWEELDSFSCKNVYGQDGADQAEDYREEIWYTEEGRPDRYRSTGLIDWLDDSGERCTILELNWIYRDDGTLFCREYVHNSMLFGTTLGSMDSYYDSAERLEHESGYITHGSYESYYIYDDDGRVPAYRLNLDLNLGYSIPEMIKYD